MEEEEDELMQSENESNFNLSKSSNIDDNETQ